MLLIDRNIIRLPEPVALSVRETDHVAGGASASYNTPGNPDYGHVPYSSGNGPVKS